MRRTRGQQHHHGGFLWGATTGRGTASVVPCMTMLFLVHSHFALAAHTVFLETNMKEAWNALLSAGSSSSKSTSSGGGGAREIVDTMLADCHGRKSEGWGAECDRALYLESVLKKIDSSSSAGSTFATGAGAANDDTQQQQQQQVALDSAANEIAVISEAELPFSAFFHEYAVPRRPVAILSGGGGAGGSGKSADAMDGEERDDLGDQAMDTVHTAQQDGKEENGQQRVQDQILSRIESCLPHSVDPALGTVDGPLRACHDSLLESLPVPRYASEDFVQRFRGQDVLPVGEHAEVERFVSGWQRLHRTRPGAYTPPTACPAGANTLITVMSGTLQVLVYSSADELPSLKPTFGNAPCSPASSRTSAGDDGDSKSSKSEGGEHENTGEEEQFDVGNGTGEEREREEHRSGSGHAEETTTSTVLNPTREPRDEGFGLERTVADQQKQNIPMESSLGGARVEDETEDTSTSAKKEQPRTLGASENTSNGHRRYSHHPSESHHWPHEPKYCADVWREDSEDNSIVTRTNAQDVSAGDNLFVPSGGAVSWRAKAGDGAEDEGAIAVRFCYVDASNFNSVKSQLPLYGAVETGANGLLQAFRSPVFDTSMSRNPSTVSASEFFEGGRKVASVNPSASSSTDADGSEAGLGADGDSSATAGENMGRKRRRLSSTEEVREEGRQARPKVFQGVAGRQPLGPQGGLVVLACERTACTVEWTNSFVKQGQDQTRLGFNLSFVPAATTNASSNAAGHGSGGGGYMEASGPWVFVGDPRLKSEHARDRDLLSLGITEGKRYTIVVDTNLAPDTLYRFSVCVVYGETAGPFSEFSKPARTSMVTAPLPVPRAPEGSPGTHAVTLRFLPPPDHGGSPVSWYHVMSRPTGEHVLSKWQAVGMAPAPAPRLDVSVHDTEPQSVVVKVEHLVPGVAYQFRVCAQNDVGTSPWSAPSEPVVVLATEAEDVKRRDFSMSGFHAGHEHLRLPNVTDVSVTYAGETEPPPGVGFDPFEREVHGPTVILDDRASKIRVASNNSAFKDIDVWTCHFRHVVRGSSQQKASPP
ncbi:unnamed protein product [Ectocarpus sp. 12 AP-2014]